MTSDFKYFLEWMVLHPWIGFLLLIWVGLVLTATTGNIARIYRREEDD